MTRRSGFGVAGLATAMVLAGAPAAADELAGAFAAGKAAVELRYRYEFVDQASFSEDAQASTLRLRLNYETGAWRAWTGFVEFDHVFELVPDDFNSGSGTSSGSRDVYPVVADPNGPDLNQLYFQYAAGDDWRTRFGRQRILLDDERFVGGVGWRQNEQTYDAASVHFGGNARSEVFYAYVANVNRITGDTVPAGDHRQDTHLLNGSFKLSDAWKLTGYAYLIDNEDSPAFSTRTLGMSIAGDLAIGGATLKVRGEIASQADNADNPASFDTGYYRLTADWNPGAFSLGAGLESLGSDGGEAFRTPLATLHAFNGWADQFLTTPAGGLEDLFLKAGYKPGKWSLQLVWHDFSAESGSGSYGSELDLSASRKLGERYGLLLKYAAFEADDDAFADTTKFWVMLTAGY